MKNKIIGGVVVAIIAFLGGWFPEHSKRSQSEDETSSVKKRLAESEHSLAVSKFRVRAALLWDQTERADYGAAGEAATKFFTDLRVFTNSLPQGALQQSLETALGKRDAVIAGLAKADPATKGLIRDLFLGMPAP